MHFSETGYEIMAAVLSVPQTAQILAALEDQTLGARRGGIRGIDTKVPMVSVLAKSAALRDIVQRYLPAAPQLVRAIYFDKSATNNWLVSWHQDRTVAVSRRFERSGWGPWSRKGGVWHVQPPLEVLEQMITLRLHLDPVTRDNGCLKIAPGSHRLGILASDEVAAQIDCQQVVHCLVDAGDAVIMRPHLVHASEKSQTHGRRRVLHFEYASYPLPAGVTWAA